MSYLHLGLFLMFLFGFLWMRDNSKYPITAKLIRDARLRSGLKQKEFISQNNLEITQETFASWETGQAQVPVDVLLKLGLAREAIVQ